VKTGGGVRRVLAAVLAGLLGLPAAAVIQNETPEVTPGLEQILERLERAARLYQDNALRFICTEEITHFTSRGRKRYAMEYIYVYDDETGFADYRLPFRKSSGKKAGRRRPEAAEARLKELEFPVFLRRAYSWIFLFQARRQKHYEYTVEGREQVLEREAVRLRFEPIPPYEHEFNDWVGTAWFDLETFQPLRVEAMKIEEHEKQRRLQLAVRAAQMPRGNHRSTHLIQQVVTEYAVQKNGMRFPSIVRFRESRFEVWGFDGSSGVQDYPVYRLHQTYDDYRFFGVRTAEEIQQIILPVTER